MLTMYMKLKPSTACRMFSGTGFLPMRTGRTAFGWSERTISRKTCLYRIIARIILMPPPVEPEQATKLPRKRIQICANIGHSV